MELRKGQKLKIMDLIPSPQFELQIFVQMRTDEADVTCFGVDAQDKMTDDRYFVFYNQTSTPEGAVTLQTTAAGSCFSVDLSKLPASIQKLVFTAAIDGHATMHDVTSGRLSLGADGSTAAAFGFDGAQFAQEKAIILCELYQKDHIWRLSIVASGFNGGLSALLAHFGGQETDAAPMPALTVPPQHVSSPVPGQKISLKKSGDTHKINLKKTGGEIRVNLNWNRGAPKLSLFGKANRIDLDLACMYRLKTGEKGVIQALGYAFGSANQPPYILLDQDDRTGASVNGENMLFTRPDLLDFAVVFAYIYEGTPAWSKTDAVITLRQAGSPDIELLINNRNTNDRFCIFASLTNHDGQLDIRREERFFQSHRDVDRAYGFNLRWKTGHK